MKGVVVWIDPRNNGMIKVKTENDTISLMELLGHEVAIGDIVKGNLENLGGETIYNVSQLEELDVFIENLFGDNNK